MLMALAVITVYMAKQCWHLGGDRSLGSTVSVMYEYELESLVVIYNSTRAKKQDFICCNNLNVKNRHLWWWIILAPCLSQKRDKVLPVGSINLSTSSSNARVIRKRSAVSCARGILEAMAEKRWITRIKRASYACLPNPENSRRICVSPEQERGRLRKPDGCRKPLWNAP